MAFWLNNGNLVRNDSGALVWCSTCPCEQSDVLTACCTDVIPRTLHAAIDSLTLAGVTAGLSTDDVYNFVFELVEPPVTVGTATVDHRWVASVANQEQWFGCYGNLWRYSFDTPGVQSLAQFSNSLGTPCGPPLSFLDGFMFSTADAALAGYDVST